MATIQIKDLALRTVIGIQDWERDKAQDILINITMDYNAESAAQSDDIKDAVDYKAVKQAVIRLVESSRFNLIEKLCSEILKIAMFDKRVQAASVTIDKPQALRFAKSVSLTMTAQAGECH